MLTLLPGGRIDLRPPGRASGQGGVRFGAVANRPATSFAGHRRMTVHRSAGTAGFSPDGGTTAADGWAWSSSSG